MIRLSPLRPLVLSALLALGCAPADEDASPVAPAQAGSQTSALGAKLARDVLLVHGAWADGSCWSEVIARLQEHGYTARAVQLREQTLSDDADLVRHAIASIARPVVVVGHSYGGFVASEASAGAKNVVGLVFVAAFAPEAGESLGALTKPYPTPALASLQVDDQGNTLIETEAFVAHFASDLPARTARVLAAVQHPTSLSILGASAGTPGWRTIPSYYQVSRDDAVIAPVLQRFFAARMKAHTIELEASHVSLLSQPDAVTALIERATRGT